jgi:hypothetical protein
MHVCMCFVCMCYVCMRADISANAAWKNTECSSSLCECSNVCMYVCMCILCICMSILPPKLTFCHLISSVGTAMWFYPRARVHICMTNTFPFFMQAIGRSDVLNLPLFAFWHIFTYAHMHIAIKSLSACMYTYIHIYIYMHIYTHIYTPQYTRGSHLG